jgi:hypothetical protein
MRVPELERAVYVRTPDKARLLTAGVDNCARRVSYILYQFEDSLSSNYHQEKKGRCILQFQHCHRRNSLLIYMIGLDFKCFDRINMLDIQNQYGQDELQIVP